MSVSTLEQNNALVPAAQREQAAELAGRNPNDGPRDRMACLRAVVI